MGVNKIETCAKSYCKPNSCSAFDYDPVKRKLEHNLILTLVPIVHQSTITVIIAVLDFHGSILRAPFQGTQSLKPMRSKF